MKIDSEGVKLAVYGVAAVAVFAVGYSVYKKVSGFDKTVSEAANKARDISERVLIGIGETGKEIGATIDNGIGKAKQALGFENDYQMPSEYGAYVVPESKWPASARFTIDAINKQRGESGYSGWTVYSDGTIISPYREYMVDRANDDSNSMNAAIIGRATENGFLSANVNGDNYDMFKDFKSVGTLVDRIPY